MMGRTLKGVSYSPTHTLSLIKALGEKPCPLSEFLEREGCGRWAVSVLVVDVDAYCAKCYKGRQRPPSVDAVFATNDNRVALAEIKCRVKQFANIKSGEVVQKIEETKKLIGKEYTYHTPALLIVDGKTKQQARNRYKLLITKGLISVVDCSDLPALLSLP